MVSQFTSSPLLIKAFPPSAFEVLKEVRLHLRPPELEPPKHLAPNKASTFNGSSPKVLLLIPATLCNALVCSYLKTEHFMLAFFFLSPISRCFPHISSE